MELWVVIGIALGLSMDAFAVSLCKGVSLPKSGWTPALWVGLCFGGFQFAMPVVGYFLGTTVSGFTQRYAPWLAFALLAFIGGKMLVENLKNQDGEACTTTFKFKELMVLGVATSIDALAVGISFALLEETIWGPSAVIGIVTFLLSFLGVLFGRKVGIFLQKKAGILGGIVLIAIGVKILLENLLA